MPLQPLIRIEVILEHWKDTSSPNMPKYLLKQANNKHDIRDK